MILNLGCGSNKITGAVNVDLESSVKPDVIADFRNLLPFPAGSVDEIYFFHTIEHIEKTYHARILCEMFRVLKHDGLLIVSYPEFTRCAQNYINNFQGKRDFWEATIYGRQLYKSDYHISLMDSRFFEELLEYVGFKDIQFKEDPDGPHYTVAYARKGEPMKGYEQVLFEEVWRKN